MLEVIPTLRKRNFLEANIDAEIKGERHTTSITDLPFDIGTAALLLTKFRRVLVQRGRDHVLEAEISSECFIIRINGIS